MLPIPSLLQMDIIKPLSSKWGLMTPSGPILGLNKRWKIKLRSKLQPACSRAVYQQCVRNQGGWAGEVGRGVFFFNSFVLLLNFCCILFSLEAGGEVRVSSSFFLVSSARIRTKRGDDLGRGVQAGKPESEFICPPPQLSRISALGVAGGMNQARHHSLCPSLLNLLPLSTRVLRQAVTATMAQHLPRLSAGFEWPSER